MQWSGDYNSLFLLSNWFGKASLKKHTVKCHIWPSFSITPSHPSLQFEHLKLWIVAFRLVTCLGCKPMLTGHLESFTVGWKQNKFEILCWCNQMSLCILFWITYLSFLWSESALSHRRTRCWWPFRTFRSEAGHNLPITIPVITCLTFYWPAAQMPSFNPSW